MNERGRKYLADILLAIELIDEFISDISNFADYQIDLKTKSAVERQLGIIGEAVNQFRRENSGVELSHTRQVVNFRNRLIHSYDNIDDSIVWTIVKRHLPILKAEIEQRLAE
ncbi:HepT-like ribonuclease domain-containing protein [Salmonirosea aquatica]|uniref:DUF86 domain-containing protein n=1 Tax=Salmonirosea aquatica TaxID=2654236 RepID=A0A7C9FZJ9_9BACT|nr:DUF86 domain-containing protein [Cytophagaceae bacterium SJW1-29]